MKFFLIILCLILISSAPPSYDEESDNPILQRDPYSKLKLLFLECVLKREDASQDIKAFLNEYIDIDAKTRLYLNLGKFSYSDVKIVKECRMEIFKKNLTKVVID